MRFARLENPDADEMDFILIGCGGGFVWLTGSFEFSNDFKVHKRRNIFH